MDKWLAQIKNDWTILAKIPEDELTPGGCLEALRQNELSILLIPAKFVTYDLWLHAVSRNGALLEYVPVFIAENPVQMKALKDAAVSAPTHDNTACATVLESVCSGAHN